MENRGPYKHIYGGTAIDVFVSRAKFANLLGVHKSHLDAFPTGMKIGTSLAPGEETCYYVIVGPRGGKHFMTTIITYR